MTEKPDGFERWLRWSREERAISEKYEKKIVEYRKSSVEFSKIVITNLHLINAGGLLGMPALANFAGFLGADRAEKIYLITTPSVIFIAGLLAAMFCGLVTYLNFAALAENCEHIRDREIARTDNLNPDYINDKRRKEIEEYVAELDVLITKSGRRVNQYFFAGHISGWLSLIAFVSAGVFILLKMR